MRASRLVYRSVVYYWRTNLAVIVGVATAVAVLAGALLVGDSVRGSLRDLVVQRLGHTDLAIVSAGFFREQLAGDLSEHEAFAASFGSVVPLVVLPGVVTEQESGRRAGHVRVYGVDDRFWAFHGVAPATSVGERDAVVNEALAREIGAQTDRAILVRVQRPSDIPLESVHGRKDDVGRTLRLTIRGVVPAATLGEFSLDPQQDAVLAVFVPLSRLQQELEIDGRVNTVLVATRPEGQADRAQQLEAIVRRTATLEDVGLAVRTTDAAGALIVESDAGLLNDKQAALIQQTLAASGMQTRGVFTYLANTLRHGDREIPYSLVSAMDLPALAAAAPVAAAAGGDRPAIVLNDWAATELRAAIGDTIGMDYFVWEDPGRLLTRSTEFRVASVVPIKAGDRDLAPRLPGITDSPNLTDWDPPFPVDLRRVRPIDEAYWDTYRTTPKAFVSLDVGQRLWRSRYGALTSLRGAPTAQSLTAARDQTVSRLRDAVDPLAMGLAVRDVRAEGMAASQGATDFGEYFIYFSFFLVVSALLLVALFFKLGIEQRVREVGLLRAVGYGPGDVRRLFLLEGAILAIAGSALGTLGAIGYAALLMAALRTWWVAAVGTTALTLHLSRASLVGGAAGGMVAALLCIWWTLRGLARVSERSLLAGQLDSGSAASSVVSGVTGASRKLAVSGAPRRGTLRRTRRGLAETASRTLVISAAALTLVGVGLMASAATGMVNPSGAFFGAGAALLVASLCVLSVVLRRPARHAVQGHGWRPISRLGMRNATYRPGRSVLSMAVIASATFIIVAVSAFHRDGGGDANDLHSGTGGYELMVESLLPIVNDPNSPEGRDDLNLFDLDPSVTLEPFRLLPGDDASCLNLYEPRSPRIIAPRDSFVAAGRFAFQDSLAAEAEDALNPWRLLHRVEPDGAVPVIADANSMTYVLHRRLGDTMVIERDGRPISLRFVAALRDSIFQSELLMSDANFLTLFPAQDGFQVLLVDADRAPVEPVRSKLESALGDFGADAISTSDRLAAFHRVENTYLSTFQTLGGLGLLLGTVGLATVLLRNVLERRRELALLGAVGYRRRHFLLMAAAENTVLVACGLGAGAICAALAIAPAVAERGGRVPITSGAALLLFSVFVVALLSSIAAMAAATRGPLLESLRSE